MRNAIASANSALTTIRPVGRPSRSKPLGTEIAGWCVSSKVEVLRNFSSTCSRSLSIGSAVSGEVGSTKPSKFAIACSKRRSTNLRCSSACA